MVTSKGVKTNLKVFGLLSVLTALFLVGGLFIGGRLGLILGLVLASVMNFGSYWFSDKIVLKMYKAKEIEESENPQLHRSLERLAEDAGIPKPRLYKSDMNVPNAFATGRSPEKGVVCVTEGLLNHLDSDEVDAVIAHELAHIRNRDTLINAVVATLAGAIAILAEMAFWGAMFGTRDRGGADMISALVFMITVPLIATVIRMSISRSMEFRADSDAVRIHGQKQGLSSALEKISGENSKKRSDHYSRVQESGANLFIENPFSSDSITGLFSTHPPLERRIENIQETELS